jgi:hypothetical protein
MNLEELMKTIESRIAQESREKKDIQEIYEPKLRRFERNTAITLMFINIIAILLTISAVTATDNPICILTQWSFHFSSCLIGWLANKAYNHHLIIEKLENESNRTALNENLKSKD